MLRTPLYTAFIPYLNAALCAMYPVLLLYAHNADDVKLSQVALPVVFSLALAAIVFSAAAVIGKNRGVSGVVTAVFMLLFWFYTPLKSALTAVLFPLPDGILIPVLLAAPLLAGRQLLRARDPVTVQKIHAVIVLPVALLVLFNLAVIIPAEARKMKAAATAPLQRDIPEAAPVDYYPDIYLIVLDEYASFVSIEQEWGYDISDFEEYLSSAGFFVARDSKTRFANTLRSLPSIMNLEYVPRDLPAAESMKLYDSNFFMDYLDRLGYGIVFIDGWGSFEYSFGIEDITFMCMYNTEVEDLIVWDPFHYLALHQSMLNPLVPMVTDDTPNLYYRVNKYFLNYIQEFPSHTNQSAQPKLLYAHLMTPHLPFVFDRDGNFMKNPTNHWEYASLDRDTIKALYLEQYIYVTRRIQEITEQILAGSHAEPIIILFSDHGVREESAGVANTLHHHRVLNAVYFPGGDYSALYDSIAPVNTMRVMMNRFFGQSYDMLDDF